MSTTTERYERRIARLLQVDNAVAFSFGRHALTAILSAWELQPGDEVILSALTCKVIPLSLLSLGLRPVYADISRQTLNLAPEAVAAAITPQTRAILFQHTYGIMSGVEATRKIALQHDLLLIEDCAQCLPLAEPERFPGHYGHAAIFSNNLGKPMPAGSGGIGVVHDAAKAARLRRIRNAQPQPSSLNGLSLRIEKLVHQFLLRPSTYWLLFGLSRRVSQNYQMRPLGTEINSEIEQTAVLPARHQMRSGLNHLQEIADLADHRRLCCAAYAAELSEVENITLPFQDAPASLYYYPVLIDRKAVLLRQAKRKRIEIIPWPITTPIYPVEDPAILSNYGYTVGQCPVAESFAARLVGLPTHKRVTAGFRRKLVQFLQHES